MKDLLRLEHISVQHSAFPPLTDYNLNIFAGEIVALHGLYGSGKESVIALFENDILPAAGRVFFHGKRVLTPAEFDGLRRSVFVLGAGKRIVESLSVIENLTAIRRTRHPFAPYNRRRAYMEIHDLLALFNLDIDQHAMVSKLTRWERQKLDLIKACISDVQLIIINCARTEFGSAHIVELIDMIRLISGRGIAFLIVSDKRNELTDIADRCQLLHRGFDLREWKRDDRLSHKQIELLANAQIFSEFNYQAAQNAGKIVCVHDDLPDCNMREYMERILTRAVKESPELAGRCLGGMTPADAVLRGQAVFVPRNSYSKLLNNLSAADNLTICIKDRICALGFIQAHRIGFLFSEFCKMMHLPADVTSIYDLDRAERKILSIHRWVLARPRVIVLEDPFAPLDQQSENRLMNYLQQISGQVQIVIVFKNAEY